MGILVYRDRSGQRDLVGRIDYEPAVFGSFTYDADYLHRARAAGELGISELLPLDDAPYTSEEFNPFFRGLMPEGDVYGSLADYYRIPRADYLSLLEQLGCESIGALMFVSEDVDLAEYKPHYEPVTSMMLEEMSNSPVRMATIAAASTRLSLSGAQSKVAWFLPRDVNAESAAPEDWLVPYGTAPSTHIIKVSRRGEEDIALNELVCSMLARACGIETPRVTCLPGVPGAICVERYDRMRVSVGGDELVIRLHQEDFCQALGLAPYFKYQPQGTDADYPVMSAELIESASANPQTDLLDFAKRLVFCYVVGNSDAHLKNFSLLYNRRWTARRLAPLYDVTCIPLTGYSTAMPFTFGEHRMLDEIDERGIMMLAADLGVGLDAFDKIARDVIAAFRASRLEVSDSQAQRMAERVVENAAPRLRVLESYLGM